MGLWFYKPTYIESWLVVLALWNRQFWWIVETMIAADWNRWDLEIESSNHRVLERSAAEAVACKLFVFICYLTFYIEEMMRPIEIKEIKVTYISTNGFTLSVQLCYQISNAFVFHKTCLSAKACGPTLRDNQTNNTGWTNSITTGIFNKKCNY
jgi:hypothetical protein